MRMQPITRNRMIVEAAITLAKKIGLKNLTFENVAEACPVKTSPGTVKRYMGTRLDMWIVAALGDIDTLAGEAKELGITND